MAEIEDVSRVTGIACKNLAGSSNGRVDPCDHRGGVKVALQCHGVAETKPGSVDLNAPVDAHNIGAGALDEFQQFAGGDTEVNPRYTGSLAIALSTFSECGATYR